MKFNLTRHRTIKDKLNAQLIKATSDDRLLSLSKRYLKLALALQEMNRKNGLEPRVDLLSFSKEKVLADIKKYQTSLKKGGQ